MSQLEKSWFEESVYLNILTMISRAEEVAAKMIIPALRVAVMHRPLVGTYIVANERTDPIRGWGPRDDFREAIAWGFTKTKQRYGWFDLVAQLTGVARANVPQEMGRALGLSLAEGMANTVMYPKLPALCTRLNKEGKPWGAKEGSNAWKIEASKESAERINSAVAAVMALAVTDEQTFSRVLTDLRYELNRVRIPPDATIERFAQVELRKPIANMVGAYQRLEIYKEQVLPKLAAMRKAVTEAMKKNSEIARAAQEEIKRLAQVKRDAEQKDLVAQQQAAAKAAEAMAPPGVSAPLVALQRSGERAAGNVGAQAGAVAPSLPVSVTPKTTARVAAKPAAQSAKGSGLAWAAVGLGVLKLIM